MALLLSYSAGKGLSGITVNELMRDYPEHLRHVPSVLAAIYLLEEERQVMVARSSGHSNYLDSIRVYPPTGIDIPPSDEFFHHDEVHSVRKRESVEDVVTIKFYRAPEDKFFVWPFVGERRRYSASDRHFKVRMHFDDLHSARECALNQGRMLTELDYLHQTG
jgi:hypothetical protein